MFEINDETIFEDIEKNLKDTMFWKFMTTSFTVNGEFRKEDFQTVLEIIASPIIKRHINEKAFMFLGQGENGKSVCLDYVKSLIGEKNISRIPLQDIAEDKFMCANLSGKSVNIFTDLESGEMKHAGKIKAITSGEGLEAQEKYMPPFTLYPFCKLMFSCNRFPKIYDQNQGFFRRWIIVKWDRNFEKDPERIEYLREKLASNQDEKNLVFSCLVFLARKLNKVGKFTHFKDWKTTQKEWNSNADPIDDFDSNYILDSDKNKTKRETYQFYKKIMLSKGEIPLGMGQFSKAFAEYHDEDRIKEKETQRIERVWLNIDFKPILEEYDAN
jgi:putative DNA primase/helicase